MKVFKINIDNTVESIDVDIPSFGFIEVETYHISYNRYLDDLDRIKSGVSVNKYIDNGYIYAIDEESDYAQCVTQLL